MKYTINMNEKQLRLVQEALDLHSRVLLGQFDETGKVAINYNVNKLDSDKPKKHAFEEHHTFTNTLRELKSILGFHPNESYGIFNKNVHEDSRIAYDMIQVIRKHLAEKHYKEGQSRLTVNFDEPMKTSTEEFITVRDLE